MLLDAMEKHHVRSITWVSFFLPLIRILVHTAYKLSITRSSSSCPRTALLVLLFMLRFGQSREIVVTSSVPWARITEITGHRRLVGSPHSRSNRLLSTAVLSFASPPTRSRYVGVAKRELFALLRFNVSSGSGCRRSISPGTMVTRSVIRHACIRRFAVSTPLYICIYILEAFHYLIISFHTLSLSIT